MDVKELRRQAEAIAERYIPQQSWWGVDHVYACVQSEAKAVAQAVKERDEELAVAHQIGDSFWAALKPLNLPVLNVANPGVHFTERIREHVEEIARLRAELEEIRQVASGENQVADDDTGGMEWIDKRIQAAPIPPHRPGDRQGETHGWSTHARAQAAVTAERERIIRAACGRADYGAHVLDNGRVWALCTALTLMPIFTEDEIAAALRAPGPTPPGAPVS